eukprot:7995527-Pyramimonas_sp.AAC.1
MEEEHESLVRSTTCAKHENHLLEKQPWETRSAQVAGRAQKARVWHPLFRVVQRWLFPPTAVMRFLPCLTRWDNREGVRYLTPSIGDTQNLSEGNWNGQALATKPFRSEKGIGMGDKLSHKFLDVARPRSDARPDFRSVRAGGPGKEAAQRQGRRQGNSLVQVGALALEHGSMING